VTELEAIIALNMVPDIGPLRMARLMQRFGSASAVLGASTRELTVVEGIGARTAENIHAWEAHCTPSAELELAEKAGVTILTLNSDGYPPLLREIPDPPPLLYVRGNIESLHDTPTNIAVVGTRRPTDYGRRMARHFGESAAYSGVTVVSGLALGIDTVVQQSAVDAGGTAVAVLGSGLAHIYPQENVHLARQISKNGAVVSEFPMRTAPSRTTFPVRNRLIAGLCRATVVVEAAHRSGALITAEQALDQGRLVLAVPGCADSAQSRGCHGLLRDGAVLVERFDDVMSELCLQPLMGQDNPERNSAETISTQEQNLNLSDSERKLLALTPTDGKGIDHIVFESGISTAQAMALMTRLELLGLARRLPGNRIARTS
jgi:DNA processing protein